MLRMSIPDLFDFVARCHFAEKFLDIVQGRFFEIEVITNLMSVAIVAAVTSMPFGLVLLPYPLHSTA